MIDACYCLTVDDKRWGDFKDSVPQPWSWPPIRRWIGVTPTQVRQPDHYEVGGHHWACYQGHRAIWQDAIASGYNTIAVFEDDAAFCGDFLERITNYEFDEDLFLLGYHPYSRKDGPLGGTHAYTTKRMAELTRHMDRVTWCWDNHIRGFLSANRFTLGFSEPPLCVIRNV